ncbi:uncharacterized protein C19orf44-like [Physella acuta]|uniref:uncharacterized protein C19orf44-like n=1 Tax=Physella acuta TaxID=109671 RepID=UPI0027DE0FF4|nr:uncharacterized protein C19orf44-like [Physella acuta]XP_059172264.1 uncharacterized protein C19orf44-like [Physella acuta]XP_059172265.1 uncharacterized protein C19orf44-like [Physella acuta]XP_059172266.1 uncharacterized protein C19orf44-like [Physella acuta]
MPAGRSNALALLQKVNSQLRGEKVPSKSKEEDELATYLNNLTQKTQKPRSVNFEEYGDLSISSGADARNSLASQGRRSASPLSSAHAPAPSKFLKKKIPLQDKLGNSEVQKNVPQLKKEDTLKGSGSTSKKKLHHTFSGESGSEDGMRSELAKRPSSADKNVGIEQNRFLKSKTKSGAKKLEGKRTPSPQHYQRSSSSDKKSKSYGGSKKNEIVRTLGNMYLTSEEESLAEFIHNLSVSDSSSRRPQNLVAKKQQKWRKKSTLKSRPSSAEPNKSRSSSPFKRSPSPYGKHSRSQSQDSDLPDSMGSEILEVRHGRRESSSSEDQVKIKFELDIPSIASPEPVSSKQKSPKRKHQSNTSVSTNKTSSVFKAPSAIEHKAAKKKELKTGSNVKSNLLENLGIHMVDELLEVRQEFRDLEISEESEIKTERSEDKRKKFFRKPSESEIVTEIGPVVKKKMASRQDSVTEISNEKSSDRRRQTDTDLDYSDSFLSDSESQSLTHSSSSRSRHKKSSKKDEKRSRTRQRKVVLEEGQLDISTADNQGGTQHSTKYGFRVSVPYGLQYVDPLPVATHVISADALEALTAYSPNMLALQEMMKAQLDLIKNFVAIQHRIYQSCMDGLNYNHKYTTLEETKEYIREHRKPTLTFKEALQLVEEEGKQQMF